MIGLTALGIIAYMVIGALIAFMFMRHHAKTQRVYGGTVFSCFLLNIVGWPLVAPIALYQYAELEPLNAAARYFNRKYGDI